jgi:hypothetical protein
MNVHQKSVKLEASGHTPIFNFPEVLEMILRWIYQLTAVACFLIAAWSLVGGFANGGGFDGIVLGLMSALFMAVTGFVIWKFAVGPAEAGIKVLGVDAKALLEKEASLQRKPQKAAR